MSIEDLQLTVELTPQTDERGVLHVVERNGGKTAFGMERAFWITNVPTGAVRASTPTVNVRNYSWQSTAAWTYG